MRVYYFPGYRHTLIKFVIHKFNFKQWEFGWDKCFKNRLHLFNGFIDFSSWDAYIGTPLRFKNEQGYYVKRSMKDSFRGIIELFTGH